MDPKFEEYFRKIELQRQEIRKRVVGMPNLVESMLICFYSYGDIKRKSVPHLLIEGLVGVGKTLILETFALTISGVKFSRIQFMPDMMPSDLVVCRKIIEGRITESPGPLIANLILGDEFNRAHDKTRNAILQAMAEGQMTTEEGVVYTMDQPFFVMANQNPVETEGTFRIGAANLDRFMMRVEPDPSTEAEEIKIAEMHQEEAPEIKPILTKTEVLEIRDFIHKNIYVDPGLRRIMVRIVRALRPSRGIITSPEEFSFWPESKRGYLFLEKGAKVRAFLNKRNYVTLSDILALAFPILNHRFELRYGKEEEKSQKVKEMISKAIKKVIEDEVREI